MAKFLRVTVILKNWVFQMLCCHTSRMSLNLTSQKLVNQQAAPMSLKMKKLA